MTAAEPTNIERVAEACTAGVTVERVSWRGWDGCYRISNAACEMIVVPQAIRPLSFRLTGGKNVLFFNDASAGKVSAGEDDEWLNFGGGRVWPTIQWEWHKYCKNPWWPPPWSFEQAPGKGEPIRGGLRLTNQHSKEFGVDLVREFVMDERAAVVRIRQTYRKTEGEAIPMCLWGVTQTRKPLMGLLPLGAGEGDERYKMIQGLPGDERNVKMHRDVASVYGGDGTKMAMPTDLESIQGWAAAVFADEAFIVSHPLEKAANYPEICHAGIYWAAQYMQMEMWSPLRDVEAGATLSEDCLWHLAPLKAEQAKDAEAAGKVVMAAHAAAMKLLAKLSEK